MSGGSYNYAYRHVEDFADLLDESMTFDGRKLVDLNGFYRLALAAHLRKVAAAMQAIEWVDSGDCSPPHDTNAIYAAIPEQDSRIEKLEDALRAIRDLTDYEMAGGDGARGLAVSFIGPGRTNQKDS